MKKRVRNKPTDVYVSATMASPASTIDSPIASAARATNVDSNSDVKIEIEIIYVSTRVAFMHYSVAFYGTVKRCFVGSRKAKNWHIVYNNGDEEEILLAVLYQQQKLYAKEEKYDTLGNPNQPATQQPQLQRRIIQGGRQYNNKQQVLRTTKRRRYWRQNGNNRW